ncbi:MAG: FeoA family protein [Firmicutes bacterium]|nr:FeoA family protein [Bacillota bacterium]MDD4264188.1 FeoA family protein [Bacillota bacterium]
MEPCCFLSQIPLNQTYTISKIDQSNKMRRRLWDLGFTTGTKITTLYSSPSGNPRAYLIRGAVIALRNEDASTITLTPISSREEE